MIVALVFLAALILYLAVLFFDAYLLSVHVPTLLGDPTNFGAWVWLIIAVASVIAMGASAKNSK